MWPHSERNVEARDTYRTYQTSSTDVSLFESSRQRLVCSAFLAETVVRELAASLQVWFASFFPFQGLAVMALALPDDDLGLLDFSVPEALQMPVKRLKLSPEKFLSDKCVVNL